MGTSLTKLVSRTGDGRIRSRLLASSDIERAAREVESFHPQVIGLTGGGGARLARLLAATATPVDEFQAWAAGSRELLRTEGLACEADYLLVSIGTGTSVLRVGDHHAERVGGTALGGGTLLGLGTALAGCDSFERLIELAAHGDRRKVDLQIADVYPEGDFPLPAAATAAAFARLAVAGAAAAPSDLALAVIGLVGENVGLLCNALAGQLGLSRIVYAGSALRDNPALCGLLRVIARSSGREPLFPVDGPFAGALGAMLLAD